MRKISFVALFLSMAILSFAQKPELVLPVIHARPITGMSCSLDGRYFVSTAYDDLKIWEASTGKLIRTIAAKEDQGFETATISADGKWLIATTDPGWEENSPTKAQHLLLLDPISGKQVRLIHTFKAGGFISHIEINLQNRYVLAVIEESTYVFDLKTGAQIRLFPGSGQFDDMGKYLVLWQDSVLALAEIETGNIETVTDEPCIDARKAGKLVTILTEEGRLKQWDTQTKMMAADFKLNLDSVYVENIPWGQAQVSRDGARCAITVRAQSGDTLAASVYWVFDAGSGKAIRDHSPIEDSFDDVLGLTAALAGYFQEITARGAQAELIYVDVPEYENAYSMKGRYKVNGDAVEVRGRLFKGKTSKGEFQVTGKKSELPGLVEAIVEKVSGMVE